MSDDPRHALGRRAETAAVRELKRRGYRIVCRNWRCPRGEVDIIARHRGDLVFVEVKARRTDLFGGPELAVNWEKQRKLSRLLDYYRGQKRLVDINCRFDIVAILMADDGKLLRCEVFEDAFEYRT